MATIASEGLDGYPFPGDLVAPDNYTEFVPVDSPEATHKLGDLAARTAFEELSIGLTDIEGIVPNAPTARTSVTAPKSLWYSKTEPDKMSDPDSRGSD